MILDVGKPIINNLRISTILIITLDLTSPPIWASLHPSKFSRALRSSPFSDGLNDGKNQAAPKTIRDDMAILKTMA